MTDPIKALIAAAKRAVQCGDIESQPILDLMQAIAAAEARLEPESFCRVEHPTRAGVRCQLPAHHDGHHQHTGKRHCYEWQARPEPAAEPMLSERFTEAMLGVSDWRARVCIGMLAECVEALAREVRK